MTRVLSIWLPSLAVERWAKTSGFAPESPVVLTVEGTHGLVIHAVTKAAAARGARVGARLTDARALEPGLIAIPADPAGDEALLQRLARWAGRWSPLVEVDRPDGLRLDVTGVAHLFGGEKALAEDVGDRFAAMGLTARVAIAPTAAAAWALSRFGRSASTVTPAKAGVHVCANAGRVENSAGMDASLRWHDELMPLHVSALRLDANTVRTLERLGLKTIGALANLPRLALARRFRGAESVVEALDRALGKTPEPLTAAPAEAAPRAILRLEEPATHAHAAPQALERLIPKLVRQLEERHLGARRLSLTGFCVDGSTAQASVATAIPSREPKHLERLLADKAAALDPGFGFDAFALQADWTETLGAAQQSLVEEPSGERDLARLVDRLSVKLGPGRVRRPQARASHVPERASGWASAIPPRNEQPFRHAGGMTAAAAGDRSAKLSGGGGVVQVSKPPPPPSAVPLPLRGRIRPEHLLDRPEAIAVLYATPEGVPRRFVWRRSVHDIARVEGPERIAPEWWRERSTARLRDYYRVEDASGRRYWIFREGLVGDGRGGAPNWYLHGLFG